jgi:hypothetical protein
MPCLRACAAARACEFPARYAVRGAPFSRFVIEILYKSRYFPTLMD